MFGRGCHTAYTDLGAAQHAAEDLERRFDVPTSIRRVDVADQYSASDLPDQVPEED